MSELPHDLLEEILCRVPATSLNAFDLLAKNGTVCSTTRISQENTLMNVSLHDGVPSLKVTCDVFSLIYHSNSHQVNINQVFHCDGSLLCTIKDNTRFVVVWKSCTGQTIWIQTGKNCSFHEFVLGNYQDEHTGNKSDRILSYNSYYCRDQEFKIYDINSNSWKNIDVTPIPKYNLAYPYYRVSLKGRTYCFGVNEKEEQLGLINFDFASERFKRLHLPYQYYRYEYLYISVAGDEKLLVLLQHHENTSRKEIWVTTNKIDEKTKEMSWSKILEVEVSTTGDEPWRGIYFLVDEKKKVVVCCEKCFFSYSSLETVFIVERDNKVRKVFEL